MIYGIASSTATATMTAVRATVTSDILRHDSSSAAIVAIIPEVRLFVEKRTSGKVIADKTQKGI